MKKLKGPMVMFGALLLLTSCATSSQFQHAKGGQVIEMKTYTVAVPPGDEWVLQTDEGRTSVEFLREEMKGHSTLIKVLLNIPTRWRNFLSEEELADDVRSREEKDMIERGVKTGEYKLEEVKKGNADIGGKQLYTMSYRTVKENKAAENVLYVYFPPEFREDRIFYEFLISQAYIQDASGGVQTTPDMKLVYPVIESFKSISFVPWVLQKAKPSENAPALILATWNGDTQSVKELLSKGANANSKGNGGMSALHYAAITGRKDIVRLLLEKGADVNATDDEGRDVLKVATFDGNEVMAMLLDKGTDINAKEGSRGWTTLMFAIGLGRVEAAKFLIERGADLEQKDIRGDTALGVAVYNGLNEFAEVLIEKGAKVNTYGISGMTPLMDAADTGNIEMVRLLLKKGADTNLRNAIGQTALQIALMKNHKEVVRLIKEAGAKE